MVVAGALVARWTPRYRAAVLFVWMTAPLLPAALWAWRIGHWLQAGLWGGWGGFPADWAGWGGHPPEPFIQSFQFGLLMEMLVLSVGMPFSILLGGLIGARPEREAPTPLLASD